MRRVLSAASAAALVIGIFAGPTLAGQPATPGCFGADRAAYIQTTLGTGAPGASEVGVILSGRAGENGAINQAYKITCGGAPTP
jgi:hypothetical protein